MGNQMLLLALTELLLLAQFNTALCASFKSRSILSRENDGEYSFTSSICHDILFASVAFSREL